MHPRAVTDIIKTAILRAWSKIFSTESLCEITECQKGEFSFNEFC